MKRIRLCLSLLLGLYAGISASAQTGPGLQLEAGGVAPLGFNLSCVQPIVRKTRWEVFLRAGAGLDFTRNRHSFFFPAGISAECIFSQKRALGRLEMAFVFPNTFADHGTHYDFITFPIPQIGYRARWRQGRHSLRTGLGLGIIPPDEDGWYPIPWPYLGYAFHW